MMNGIKVFYHVICNSSDVYFNMKSLGKICEWQDQYEEAQFEAGVLNSSSARVQGMMEPYPKAELWEGS